MKLLASDFDNTLWFYDHMKDEDVKAIHQFQKDGNLFGICTGRSLKGIVVPSTNYSIDYDFYILLSGAQILNKNKEIIFEKKIPIQIVRDVYEVLNHQEMSIVCFNEMYKLYQHRLDTRGIYIQSLKEIPSTYVNSFSFHFEDDEIPLATQATQIINDQFGEYITAFQNNQHIDIAAKGCSKGEGIKIIQEYFHLKDSQMHCIGDSWNDLPMLTSIQNSFTFTYAVKEVQNKAKSIVSNLAEAIKMI